jgi:hypothetical protein
MGRLLVGLIKLTMCFWPKKYIFVVPGEVKRRPGIQSITGLILFDPGFPLSRERRWMNAELAIAKVV